MFEKLGYLVDKLTRIQYGFLTLENLKSAVENTRQPDFSNLANKQLTIINNCQLEASQYTTAIVEQEARAEELNSRLLKLSEEKNKVSTEELNAYNASHSALIVEHTGTELNVKNIKAEIKKLKDIIDTCPTCGQHLPHIHKPDTSYLEEQLVFAEARQADIYNNIIKCNKQHQEYLAQIDGAFGEELAMLNQQICNTKSELATLKNRYNESQAILDSAKASYNKILYDQQHWDKYISNQRNEISKLEAEVARLTNIISVISLSKDDFDQRLAIIKKMDTLIRRDFRGYLLTNIINYIDNKAKDYCSTVFGTKELSLALNGNALDITYCGKPFDGLSGGEKQRVDLILQLSIRDLLSSYLGLSANILVLDEITDFLDEKSCRAVMQLLEKELKTVESVFIISHRANTLEIPVDSEIVVIKNINGISELN